MIYQIFVEGNSQAHNTEPDNPCFLKQEICWEVALNGNQSHLVWFSMVRVSVVVNLSLSAHETSLYYFGGKWAAGRIKIFHFRQIRGKDTF